MRESKIERYLHLQVRKAGGDTRKNTGRIHIPDRLVIWPGAIYVFGTAVKHMTDIHFVETKAPGKKARPGQLREHARLRKLGCTVWVLDTKEKIDHYIEVSRP